MFGFGAYAFVWGTTVSQPSASAPCRRSSRAGSAVVYTVGVFGGIVVGQALGGVIADALGR